MAFQQFSERPAFTTSPQEQEKWKDADSLKWPAIILLSMTAIGVILVLVF